ncbi:hypothetical protein [Mycolicibacterium sp.]|uniref:hypothetical protein n=1 Tax=Mycolicibacterium sp. TaxID=2320850 RepID=UPI0037C5DD29
MVAVLLAAVAIAAGCGKDENSVVPVVTPDHAQTSPSGTYTAFAQHGPQENGQDTWVVVIRDEAGNEVFHDRSAYSPAAGVMITWLSTEPAQLWVYSGDTGVYRIAPGSHGGWTRAGVKPDNMPSEISSRWESSRS